MRACTYPEHGKHSANKLGQSAGRNPAIHQCQVPMDSDPHFLTMCACVCACMRVFALTNRRNQSRYTELEAWSKVTYEPWNSTSVTMCPPWPLPKTAPPLKSEFRSLPTLADFLQLSLSYLLYTYSLSLPVITLPLIHTVSFSFLSFLLLRKP